MNYKYKKLKLQDCSYIIQNKNRGVLSICEGNYPYQDLVFYDTDCFCGCIVLYFKVCKCGELIEKIQNNNNASLLVTNSCNNAIDTVTLTGTLELLEEEEDCCCEKKKDCFRTVRFSIENIKGKRYCKC